VLTATVAIDTPTSMIQPLAGGGIGQTTAKLTSTVMYAIESPLSSYLDSALILAFISHAHAHTHTHTWIYQYARPSGCSSRRSTSSAVPRTGPHTTGTPRR
jgi:hypothetical protein